MTVPVWDEWTVTARAIGQGGVPVRCTLQKTSFGPRLEVYTDDDGASGLGENPRYGYWWADSLEELMALDVKRVALEFDVDDFFLGKLPDEG